MDSKHRFIVGGLFFCHGLIRAGLAMVILSVNPAMTFSAAMVTLAMAVPSLFGAYNLLTNKKSAHSIMMIAAIVNLLSFFEGTAIAIYYYWFWKYQCGSPNPFRDEAVDNSDAITCADAKPAI